MVDILWKFPFSSEGFFYSVLICNRIFKTLKRKKGCKATLKYVAISYCGSGNAEKNRDNPKVFNMKIKEFKKIMKVNTMCFLSVHGRRSVKQLASSGARWNWELAAKPRVKFRQIWAFNATFLKVKVVKAKKVKVCIKCISL